MMIGRWSDDIEVIVFHVVLLNRLFVTVVMSGEVGCCRLLLGSLVGVLVLSTMWLELEMMSFIRLPLWSSYGECHSFE